MNKKVISTDTYNKMLWDKRKGALDINSLGIQFCFSKVNQANLQQMVLYIKSLLKGTTNVPLKKTLGGS
jgi:hypothetical protein